MAFEFNSENRQKLEGILARYPEKQAAMLPALWLVQKQEGWVSPQAMEKVAEIVGVTPSKVYEVVTFYTMFYLSSPPKYHFQVCRTLPCQLMGAEAVSCYLQNKLGIKLGEKSGDGKFMVTEVECLGSCGTAPMLQLNDDFHENLTEEKLDQLIESLA